MHPDQNSGNDLLRAIEQSLKEQAGAKEKATTTAPATSGGALRFNQGKPAFSAFPLDLCEGAARVMAKGRIKYPKGNYRKGYTTPEEPLDSLIRHVGALQRALEADDTDGSKGHLFDESGEAHIHHVVTSAVLLIQTMRLLGWDVEKSVPRAFKLPDGRVLPDVGQDVPKDSTLFINGIRQDGEKEKK